MSRIVAYDADNVAVGLFDTIDAAAKETNISKHDIARNLRGFGPKFIRGYTFGYEVTMKDIREAQKKIGKPINRE